MSSLE